MKSSAPSPRSPRRKRTRKGWSFSRTPPPDIPEVLLGDPLRLGQILTNFVNNAVKFTERGEIRLNIELLERTGEKVQLKFSVCDTGLGMTREQAAKLFQPFTQADMSITRKARRHRAWTHDLSAVG
jgi:signal transduction histidine kinase